MGFFHKKNFKSAQIGHFGAKNAQKVPFSENASKFFCPLLVFKTGLLPTFSGLFSGKLSVHAQKFFRKWAFARIRQTKVGYNLHNFQVCTDSFLSSPNPSVPFINQNNPTFDLKASQLAQVKQCMQQSMKSFVFFTINILEGFVSGRVRISFGISSRISSVRHDAGTPFF